MCMSVCVKIPIKARWGHQITWKWSKRRMCAIWHGCWEMNVALLLTAEPSLQHQQYDFNKGVLLTVNYIRLWDSFTQCSQIKIPTLLKYRLRQNCKFKPCVGNRIWSQCRQLSKTISQKTKENFLKSDISIKVVVKFKSLQNMWFVF